MAAAGTLSPTDILPAAGTLYKTLIIIIIIIIIINK